MLYFFYPDKKVEVSTNWRNSPKNLPANVIVYDPQDLPLPWVISNIHGGFTEIQYRMVPKWIKVYALLLD